MPGAIEGVVVLGIGLFGTLIPIALFGLILYILFQIRRNTQDLACQTEHPRPGLRDARYSGCTRTSDGQDDKNST